MVDGGSSFGRQNTDCGVRGGLDTPAPSPPSLPKLVDKKRGK